MNQRATSQASKSTCRDQASSDVRARYGGVVNTNADRYGPTGVMADEYSAQHCESSPSKAARVIPALFKAWARVGSVSDDSSDER